MVEKAKRLLRSSWERAMSEANNAHEDEHLRELTRARVPYVVVLGIVVVALTVVIVLMGADVFSPV